MKIICSYCRKEMGQKEPLENTTHTHSMCKECYDYYIDQISGISFDEYLDRFDLPVLIVDSEGRIAASNRQAQAALDKTERQITGFLGGEAMECPYARLPEGCGHTEHCLTCTIRNTIMETHETGRTVHSRKTYLMQEDRQYTLVISTHKVEGFVQVIVEEMY